MKLSIVQKRELYERGFVRVPGVIPPVMVREAVKTINHAIVTQGIPPEKLPIFHSQSFCPEVQGSAAIKDLFNKTPMKSLAESLLGEGNVSDAGGGQIALRFPSFMDPPREGSPHVDGMYSPTNGVKPGVIEHFSMLGAVFLSDVVEPFNANFTVWPGTHRTFEKYFQEHGPETLLKGMPPVPMPAPEQVMVKAGDIVFTNYQLAHSVAPNLGPNIRYAIFFRVWGANHKKLGFDCMTNIWAEMPGMYEVLPEEERKKAEAGLMALA